jgi:hypothetical protein
VSDNVDKISTDSSRSSTRFSHAGLVDLALRRAILDYLAASRSSQAFPITFEADIPSVNLAGDIPLLHSLTVKIPGAT